MKKTVAILLVLLMLGSTSGCTLNEEKISHITENAVENITETVEKGNELFEKVEEMMGTPSLWGKELSVSQVETPFDPTAGEDQFCTGMSHDGERLLIFGGTEGPYLWDIENEESIPLYFGDENQDRLSSQYANSFGSVGEYLQGEALFDAVFTSGVSFLVPVPMGLNALDHYMLVQVTNSDCQFVLDTDTGALYCSESGSVGGVYDGEVLTYHSASSGPVFLQELGSDSVREVDFNRECKNGDFSVSYVTFLPDGSICAVMRETQLDMVNGQECLLVVRNAEGEFESYSLGKILLGVEPKKIVGVGSEWIIASGSMIRKGECPYIINRNTGEVGRLARDGMDFEIADLGESGEEFGLDFLCAMADGETALFYNWSESRLGLFNAKSMEACWLGEEIVISNLLAITGNGYDKFVCYSGVGESKIIEIDVK